MLSLEGITQRFGRVTALDGASLTVRAGTVRAVLGENGAGKTTLMRVAFGALQPTAGVIRLDGAPVILPSPAAALTRGVGMVHQHFTLVPAMTVAENVALGGHGRYDPSAASQRVRDVAQRAGLALDPQALVADLSVGAQQRCEIVKALARNVRLLILDEPTAVLAPSEAAELLRWVRNFADAGHAVVLITHKLRDALAVADELTVLRRGRTVLSIGASHATETLVSDAMLGRAASAHRQTAKPLDVNYAIDGVSARTTRPFVSNEVVLRLDQVHVVDMRGVTRLRNATLAVTRGEIVGIAGVEGAGQHELLRVLAGRMLATRGTVSTSAQVGFVPEDRHRDAMMLDASLSENLALRDAGSRRGLMPWDVMERTTSTLLAQYDVRATGASAMARTLSGGNQQKFVLARELDGAHDALVVENPSRGLDFHATDAVHRALRAARARGAAIVLYSSDIDELLLLADRALAMYDGSLIPAECERNAIGLAMLGSTLSQATK